MTTENKDKSPAPMLGHEPRLDTTCLSAGAETLLHAWRAGDNFSEPSPDVGPFAYSSHAEIFFNNAERLCDDDGMSDFRVYGAIYLLRHGVELMLKCWARNPQIDTILREIMGPGGSFNDVAVRLWPNAKERKKKGPILLHAVCAIRNRLEDKLSYPDARIVNISEKDADRALEYLRAHPETDRFFFAPLWPVAPSGHKLDELWLEAAPVMAQFMAAAERHAFEAGYSAPLSEPELAATVELLGAMDDGGDGLRYPSSVVGAWYLDPPRLSLQAVGLSAGRLRWTCDAFADAREAAYSMSTFGRPTPH